MPVDCICQRCGSHYRVRPSKSESKFCSRDCKYQHSKNQKACTCLQCGESFSRRASRKGGKFCSRKCKVASEFVAVELRFFRHIGKKQANGCIHWSGKTNVHGYGVIESIIKKLRSNRVAYELCVGPIPAGLHVLHHCDNPLCINPTHLFTGTHQDNMRDMNEKGRAGWQRRAARIKAQAT